MKQLIDYVNYIKENTTLTDEEAKDLAIYCIGRNIPKEEAAEMAN